MASSNLRSSPQTKNFPPTSKHLASGPLTPTALYAIKAFSLSRIILGAASVLNPPFTCGLFRFLISNETALVVRLFGVRGVALGGLLITAGDNPHLGEGRRELRRLLWANVSCDIIDICTLLFAVVTGQMDQLPATFLVGGAAMLVGIGFLGLRAL